MNDAEKTLIELIESTLPPWNLFISSSQEREVQLSPEEASEIYAKFYGSIRFPNMVVSISQAPVTVLSLGGIDAVKIWNHIIGPDGTLPSEWFLPDWISRKFGQHGEIVDALHGSKNLFYAENETRYFFPEST